MGEGLAAGEELGAGDADGDAVGDGLEVGEVVGEGLAVGDAAGLGDGEALGDAVGVGLAGLKAPSLSSRLVLTFCFVSLPLFVSLQPERRSGISRRYGAADFFMTMFIITQLK
jgi:hypothetical protein